MNLADWKNKRILILGFGKEGQATLQFLLKTLPEAVLGVADQRALEKMNDEEKKLLELVPTENHYLGGVYLDKLANFDLIIKSPGINPRLPAIAAAKQTGVTISSATNIFFNQKKGQVIAVTGSKGKSTTASLIYAVLKAGGKKVELIGNIGKPALAYLDDKYADSSDKIYVFEMSSYQLEDFDGSADVAVLINFFPEHLDYHGSLEAYFQAKMQLVARPQPGQKIIYNFQTPQYREYFAKMTAGQGHLPADQRAILLPFNDQNSLVKEENGDLIAWADGQKIVNLQDMQLPGRHNLENLLAVYQVAKLFQINLAAFQQAVCAFHPLEHRLEMVGTYQEIVFYNDAISTTPESTIAAIEALSRDKKISTLIAWSWIGEGVVMFRRSRLVSKSLSALKSLKVCFGTNTSSSSFTTAFEMYLLISILAPVPRPPPLPNLRPPPPPPKLLLGALNA
jgi:UDP-N-acetylmuramoylalanine--D-glutamate ligase